MIRHCLKVVWNRKRANALIVLEIFVSFLVVFAVALAGLGYLGRVGVPLGFDHADVYTVTVDSRTFDNPEPVTDAVEVTRRLFDELRALPEVVSVAAMDMSPFEMAYQTDDAEWQGRTVDAGYTWASDGAAEVLGIVVSEGRWFEKADDALAWTPVVVNRPLVEELFQGTDPLGEVINSDPELRVVGVVEGFRRTGSFGAIEPFVIRRMNLAEGLEGLPRTIMARVRPGSGVAVEERLQKLLLRLAPQSTPQIELTESIRKRSTKLMMAPFVVGVVVAGFLLFMVVLGMVGVFWQAVTRRTGELGLRRALGGARGDIHRQVLTEIVIVAFIGCLVGAVLVVQLPLLGVLGAANWARVLAALAVSTLVMAGLALVSGLYPAWLATRIEPAQALYDE